MMTLVADLVYMLQLPQCITLVKIQVYDMQSTLCIMNARPQKRHTEPKIGPEIIILGLLGTVPGSAEWEEEGKNIKKSVSMQY